MSYQREFCHAGISHQLGGVRAIQIVRRMGFYRGKPEMKADLPAHWSFAYSVLASFRMGMSGSASFRRVRKP
jgi:hypothetical protein